MCDTPDCWINRTLQEDWQAALDRQLGIVETQGGESCIHEGFAWITPTNIPRQEKEGSRLQRRYFIEGWKEGVAAEFERRERRRDNSNSYP